MTKSLIGICQVNKKYHMLKQILPNKSYLRFLFWSTTILTSAMKWLLESLVDGDIKYLDTDSPGNLTLYDS